MVVENKEFQELLKKYPDNLPVTIAVSYNNHKSIFTDIEVKGIACHGMKVVIITSKDVDYEYETLLNGADVDEEIYSE